MKLSAMRRSVFVCAALLLLSLPTQAALVRVDLDGNSNDHEGVYDSVLDITWLADANLAATNNFGVSTVNPDGSMNWSEVALFIAAMNTHNGLGYLGVNTWRQTSTSECDGNYCGDVATDTDDELGYHYYRNFETTLGEPMTSGANTANAGLFDNIRASYYWGDLGPDATRARLFSANIGRQTYGLLLPNEFFVWAVAPGMVGSSIVPVPGAVWLFGSALIGIIGLARRC